ncbi:MAG: 2-oxoacid:acceptor oxidoreductase subunit alpha [Deltaproteobacteria bacterium]|nr:2-oxoacid:acceptor oxidoreductase subunit alpha [Deltaproteobacteria bacterium]MCB9479580.1 2-oxoacid:acceptor oxidoreductase subunit alpha [Deltaproteobacteria bacterium]MCB9488816.1 2-oxoacid:acceptor oxidoreductase subunit alpha [Deltaproteobacteria bacterium]
MVEAGAGSREDTARPSQELESVVIRFAGDSGDGIQLTGTQFTNTSFIAGNDLSTLPDFPAEIRAPAGSLAGVSGFQLQLSSQEVHTPGDTPDVLVCMNPAALKVNLPLIEKGKVILLNTSTFNSANIKKAGYEENPLEDGTLDDYQVFPVDITALTLGALEDSDLSQKEKTRCKNFFALGLLYWLYNRKMDTTEQWLNKKFSKAPELAAANIKVMHAGYNYGVTTEMFASTYEVKPAQIQPGKYRNVTGNTALSLGMVAASQLSGLPVFLGTYPITPASDILHDLARFKNFGIVTFQAEDEIAGVCSAIGASYGGSIGLTSTSGPGLALKSEAMGLAVIMELPLVVVDVQRGGPSTGLPTKPEQADLLAAMFGRHGECPAVVLAPATPADCFDIAIEAVRLATKYMTPVIILSDGFIANSSEAWHIPEVDTLPDLSVRFTVAEDGKGPFTRDPETLSRPWIRPGTPGLTHRVGGLEKDFNTGNVSYDPDNHEKMIRTRAAKVAGIAKDIEPAQVVGPESGDVLILSWGSPAGTVRRALEVFQKEGASVAGCHLRHLNPFPADLGQVMAKYRHVVIPEMNLGQLRMLITANYDVRPVGINKVKGQPFRVSEIVDPVRRLLQGVH